MARGRVPESDTHRGDEQRDAFAEISRGRGLTRVIAIAAGMLTWRLMRGIRAAYRQIPMRKRDRAKSTRLQIVEYAFRARSPLLVIFAVMAVLAPA